MWKKFSPFFTIYKSYLLLDIRVKFWCYWIDDRVKFVVENSSIFFAFLGRIEKFFI